MSAIFKQKCDELLIKNDLPNANIISAVNPDVDLLSNRLKYTPDRLIMYDYFCFFQPSKNSVEMP